MRAYLAAFRMGAREALRDRADIFSAVVIYTVLLTVFSAIYAIMPVHELGVAGLTGKHLLWYFAITECVVVSSPGLARFGMQIADGRLTEMMQRPVTVTGMAVSRFLGMHLMVGLLLFCFLLVIMPLLFGAPLPLAPQYLPLLFISFFMSALLVEMMTCMVGTIEVLGPYSRPASWIIGKFIFAFGGLFFPVAFFPEWLQTFVWMTPFPAVISVPANFMLLPDMGRMLHEMGIQLFWIVILAFATAFSEKRMLSYVMERGD